LDITGGKAYTGSTISGKLSAKWLHGALASNLKANIAVTLSQTTTSFKKFPEYIFDDPTRTCPTEEKVIYEGQLDESGNAEVSATLSPGVEAPGMLKAGFITKVFEESGDFSIDMTTVAFSPYDYYIGLKTLKTMHGQMFFTWILLILSS